MAKFLSILAVFTLVGVVSIDSSMAARCDGNYDSAKDFWMDQKLCR